MAATEANHPNVSDTCHMSYAQFLCRHGIPEFYIPAQHSTKSNTRVALLQKESHDTTKSALQHAAKGQIPMPEALVDMMLCLHNGILVADIMRAVDAQYNSTLTARSHPGDTKCNVVWRRGRQVHQRRTHCSVLDQHNPPLPRRKQRRILMPLLPHHGHRLGCSHAICQHHASAPMLVVVRQRSQSSSQSRILDRMAFSGRILHHQGRGKACMGTDPGLPDRILQPMVPSQRMHHLVGSSPPLQKKPTHHGCRHSHLRKVRELLGHHENMATCCTHRAPDRRTNPARMAHAQDRMEVLCNRCGFQLRWASKQLAH